MGHWGQAHKGPTLVHGSSFLSFLVFTMLRLSRINSTLPSLLQEGETLKLLAHQTFAPQANPCLPGISVTARAVGATTKHSFLFINSTQQ